MAGRAWENDSASGMSRWVRQGLEFAAVPQRRTQRSAGMSPTQQPLPGSAGTNMSKQARRA